MRGQGEDFTRRVCHDAQRLQRPRVANMYLLYQPNKNDRTIPINKCDQEMEEKASLAYGAVFGGREESHISV